MFLKTLAIFLISAVLYVVFSPSVDGGAIGLSSMISNQTRHSASEYTRYGRFCGVGGSGRPVDAIDRCCLTHDNCYGRIDKSCGISHAILVSYEWEVDGRNRLVCNSTSNDRCKQSVCRCDVDMVICFKRNERSFDKRHLRYLPVVTGSGSK